jgi:4-amino-4-deoxy-L-arabinose transferase-like glycosyltransferase
LWTHIVALNLPHAGDAKIQGGSRWEPSTFKNSLENDERIYVALVDQIKTGKGYTLRGHPIMSEPWINQEQYDRAIFFHPPGGVALFWLLNQVVGEKGFALAEVISFCVFFLSVMAMGRATIAPMRPLTVVALATLAAFNPILAHVAGRLWLDGPLLAFATAGAAAYFVGLRQNSLRIVALGGLLLGFASLIKLTAFLVIPGMVALTFALPNTAQPRVLLRRLGLFIGVAVVVQAPWEFWQWAVVGSPFPVWSGKPAQILVQTNGFIRYLTVVRSPWIYLELLPQVLWTSVPALLLFALQWPERRTRRIGVALLFWIAVVLGAHIWLGAIGYSKLLRYAILVTPATVLMFSMLLGEVVAHTRERWREGGTTVIAIGVLVIAIGGIGLELVQYAVTAFVDNPRFDVIMPLTGLSGFSR